MSGVNNEREGKIFLLPTSVQQRKTCEFDVGLLPQHSLKPIAMATKPRRRKNNMTTCSVILAFLLIVFAERGFSLHLQDLSRMSRNELQFIAKINGIKANGKTSEIRDQLEERGQSLVFVSSLMPTSDNKVINKQRAMAEKKRELLQQQAVQAERTANTAINDLGAALEALQEAKRRHEEALTLKEEVDVRIQRCKEEIKALDGYRKRRETEVQQTQMVAKRKRDAVEQINNKLNNQHTTEQENIKHANTREPPKQSETSTDDTNTIIEWTKTIQHVVEGTQQLLDRVAQNVKNFE